MATTAHGRLAALWALIALLSLGSANYSIAYDYVFSEFGSPSTPQGFGYLFDGSGFQQDFTSQPGASRLFDLGDAAGGAGIYLGEGIDFTDFATSQVEIDFTIEPGHAARHFEFELYDVNNHAVKWRFDLQDTPAGVPQSRLSTNTLGNPEILTNAEPGDFDLSQVRLMQIVGDYNPISTVFDISFDRIVVSNDLPDPPAYPGAEPDAQWRVDAAARIDAHRKADLQVNVLDALGNAVPGATVSVAMQKHEFGFGTAVSTPKISEVSDDAITYRQKITELFNLAVTENSLKWQPWAGDWGPKWEQDKTLQALDWLQSQDIPVRGHNILWPGENVLPQAVLPLVQSVIDTGEPLDVAEQAQLRSVIASHISDIVQTVGDRVAVWDVVNEPRVNHVLMDALDEGRGAMVDWFNQARAANGNAKLFLNEYSIVNTGGNTSTADQQEYFDELTALVQAGAPIDGLGIQSHFRDDTLTGPEDYWEILDRFATLGLSMEITEFDFESTDRDLQAQYLRDFLTATFAHEGVDSFLQWGFWAGRHWRPEAALFDLDWTIRPHGQAYLDLVYGEWWTDEEALTSPNGETRIRGFKGDYEITVTRGGETIVVPATLTEAGLVVDVSLDIRPGDFNGDGTIDVGDYSIWRDRLGTTVLPFANGDADGDGVVTRIDWTIWQQNFGRTAATHTSSEQSVPEQRTYALMLASVLSALVLRQQRWLLAALKPR